MQAPEEPRPAARPAALTIPSPEQLGLAPAENAAVDWAATRARLQQVGATTFQLDHVPGGCKFTCWLPAEQAGKSYRVEAEGAAEAEAVRLCLERAERWVRRAP
jgi:hypothetical protein